MILLQKPQSIQERLVLGHVAILIE